ncbi:MAG: glycoside hydrolase family 99-like domain-containing protein [Verrucomicrobiota bacterium]|jgi:hypothetical protein
MIIDQIPMNLRRFIISSCSTAGIVAAMLLSTTTDAQDRLPQERAGAHWTNVPRQVLAFYYGWYGNPATSGEWVHWKEVDAPARKIGGVTHYPALGPYDSHDRKLIQQHCLWAKNAGLTGFIATWWRAGGFHDRGLPLLLDEAEKHGLSITVYLEIAQNQDNAVKDLLYILAHYGKHPAWLKVDGKPVVFIYERAVNQIKLTGWRRVIDEVNKKYRGGALFVGDQITQQAAKIFDGVHTYNPTSYIAGKTPEQIRAWAHAAYPDWVRIAGKDRIACLTVIPGYDDGKLGRPDPRPITDRYDGETCRVLLEEAVAANPDWILITSWNEWHEGSEVEPSVEYGDRSLKVVSEFAPRFSKLPPRTH